MTSFIYHGEEDPLDEMKVNNSIEGPIPLCLDSDSPSQKNITKSIFLKRKNMSLKNSKIICSQEEGIIFGSKFSGKKVQEEPQDHMRINRSLKIDCSGPANIVTNPNIFNQEYVPLRTKKNMEEKQIQVTQFQIEKRTDNPSRIEFQQQPLRPQTNEARVGQVELEEQYELANLDLDMSIEKHFTVIFTFILLFLILSITNETINSLSNKLIVKPFSQISMKIFK